MTAGAEPLLTPAQMAALLVKQERQIKEMVAALGEMVAAEDGFFAGFQNLDVSLDARLALAERSDKARAVARMVVAQAEGRF